MQLDPEALADVVVQAIDVALGPVLERLAGQDARIAMLGDLRDRVVTVETKALQPAPGDPAIDALEARVTRGLERLAATELRLELKTAEIGPLQTSIAELTKENSGLRERLAVLETRAPVAGPAGNKGLDGKDGVDGLGFDDLEVEFDGDRTLALKFARGDRTKTWPIVLPFQRYEGVYLQGKSYDVGDTVTWAGQLWHCREATITPPGDASKLWQLCVRKGRDGRDGQDAPGALPVVSVGRR